MNELKNIELIDSHCHLDYEQIYDDLDNIIYRANQNKVTEFISICTTLSGIKKIEDISKRYDFIWHTAGIHPHKAGIDEFSNNFEKIKKYCLEKKCVGVGEAGLDYYYDFSSKNDAKTYMALVDSILAPFVLFYLLLIGWLVKDGNYIASLNILIGSLLVGSLLLIFLVHDPKKENLI